MDWLKDKKNQPIIAVAAFVVILAVVAVMYFTMFKSDSSSTDTTAETAPASDPTMGMPAAPPTAGPGRAPAAPATAPSGPAAQVATAGPMEAWRSDPFLPIGYKPPAEDDQPKPEPHIWDLPMPSAIFHGYPTSAAVEELPVYESPQPARRMAGLMLNGKVYAIIETNGASEIVQPGDTLKDGLATVEKIERDKVILKTTDEKPRRLVVSMAANRQASASVGGTGRPSTGSPSVVRPGAPGTPPMPGGRPGMPAP